MKVSAIKTKDDFFAYCKRRVARKYDNFIVITGKPGIGKSNLARYLADKFDPTFNLNRVTFSGREFIGTSEKCSPGKAVIWDEIPEGGAKIDATTREGKAVRRHLMTGRSLRLHSIACGTHLDDFQTYLTGFRINWWLWVHARGLATIYYPNTSNPFPKAKASYLPILDIDFPEMEPDKLAAYESKKEEWRTRWHRDSDLYAKHAQDSDRETVMVNRYVRMLSWLPTSIEASERALLRGERSGIGLPGKPKKWEEAARQHLAQRMEGGNS